jgi:hypothetical protein
MLCMSAHSAHIHTTRTGAKPSLALTHVSVSVLAHPLDEQDLPSLPIRFPCSSHHP